MGWKNLKAKGKLVSYHYPYLYYTYYRCFGKDKSLLIHRNSRLVIEGFPRSANTFTVVFLEKYLTNGGHIAHHLHNPSQILLALQWNIPCIVLIREPESAVVSFIIRNGISIKTAFNDYINFYQCILDKIENVDIVTFEEITSDPGNILRRLHENHPTLFSRHEIQNIDQEVIFTEIEQISRHNFNKISENEVARPSKSRSLFADKIKADIRNPKYEQILHQARVVYEQIISTKD